MTMGICRDVSGVVVLASAALMVIIYCVLQTTAHLQDFIDVRGLRPPSTLDDVKTLHQVLTVALEKPGVKEVVFPWVVLSYISIYLFKQAFSIPGSVLLNMLSGAMFGDWPGFALVCVLTACGTSCCYIISSLFGKRLADRLFGAKIFRVQKAIDNHRSNLFLYLLALRVFPFTPNFFLNLCSPLVGVPFLHFFFSVFFGLMPYNFLTVKAGGILSELDDVNQIFDTQNLLKLVVLATLILLPTFCKSRLIKIANLDLAENSPAKVKSS